MQKEKNNDAVLFVDDEICVLNTLKRIFRDEKFQVLIANNGQQGLEILQQESSNIRLIVSDQRMPKMTGTEFLQAAKIQKMLVCESLVKKRNPGSLLKKRRNCKINLGLNQMSIN